MIAPAWGPSWLPLDMQLFDPSVRARFNLGSLRFGDLVFGVSVAEREPQVDPDRMLDDNRRKPVTRYESSIIRSAYSHLPPWPSGYTDKASLAVSRTGQGDATPSDAAESLTRAIS